MSQHCINFKPELQRILWLRTEHQHLWRMKIGIYWGSLLNKIHKSVPMTEVSFLIWYHSTDSYQHYFPKDYYFLFISYVLCFRLIFCSKEIGLINPITDLRQSTWLKHIFCLIFWSQSGIDRQFSCPHD